MFYIRERINRNPWPRMFLIENGYFGDPNPDVNSLHQLLVAAFLDFKTFQKHHKLNCSQTKFVPNFVPWVASMTASHDGFTYAYIEK